VLQTGPRVAGIAGGRTAGVPERDNRNVLVRPRRGWALYSRRALSWSRGCAVGPAAGVAQSGRAGAPWDLALREDGRQAYQNVTIGTFWYALAGGGRCAGAVGSGTIPRVAGGLGHGRARCAAGIWTLTGRRTAGVPERDNRNVLVRPRRGWALPETARVARGEVRGRCAWVDSGTGARIAGRGRDTRAVPVNYRNGPRRLCGDPTASIGGRVAPTWRRWPRSPDRRTPTTRSTPSRTARRPAPRAGG